MGIRARREGIEPEQRGPDDRVARRDPDSGLRRHLVDALGNRLDDPRRDRPQEASAEHDVRVRVGQPEARQNGVSEGDHLIGEAANDAGRDRVLVAGGEHDRGQLGQPGRRDLPQMQGAGDRVGIAEPEVGRHARLEHRPRAPAVRAAGRGGERGQTDVSAPAPVPADRAERREADLAPVRRAPEAVDPGAAHHGHPPPAVGAGPQQGDGVVVEGEALAPAQGLDPGAHRGELLGEVGAREQDLRHRRDRALASREPRAVQRGLQQALEHRDAAVDPDVVGRAAASPDEGQQRAVGTEQSEVGLGAAPVDREHDALRAAGRRGLGAHAPSPVPVSAGRISVTSISSSRSSASPNSRTSGLASSARRAVSRSQPAAAAAASRS